MDVTWPQAVRYDGNMTVLVVGGFEDLLDHFWVKCQRSGSAGAELDAQPMIGRFQLA